MPAPAEPTRRFALALTAAAASTTIAVGVTAATLFGWFRTAETSTAAAVPTAPVEQPPALVEPSPDQIAIEQPRHHDDREHEREDHEDDDE
jgi:hypothetical protein